MNKHWGEFPKSNDENNFKKSLKLPPTDDIDEHDIEEIDEYLTEQRKTKKRYASRNPVVKQTIEVMDQTDIIKDLIETYQKPGNTYGFQQYQIAPKLEIRTSSEINHVKDTKFSSPLWFIPPISTKFTLGQPKDYAIVNKKYISSAMRRSLCGLLRIHNFKNSTHSALTLFIDAVEEFYKNLMNAIKNEYLQNNRETEINIDVMAIERAYQHLTRKSLLTLHSYYKYNIVKKNRKEIEDFKNYSQEYDKIVQMNQKPPNIKEEDLASYLGYPEINYFINNTENPINVTNMFETGEQEGLGDIFDHREFPESNDEKHNYNVPTS